MDTTYKTLKYQARPAIVTVTLNRPRAFNMVNLDMAIELSQVCQRLREEKEVRVAIITGSGQVFSSGRETLSFSLEARGTYSPPEWLALHRAASALARVELPLVAAINGDAIDQGLELALACDLRIAAKGAKLGFSDLGRGVVPWDGGTQRLPRLIGRTRALNMLLTSRLMDAEEACRVGLVNRVVEPEELLGHANDLALEIASGAPIAARYAKETVLKGMEMPIEDGLRLEADLNIILQSTSDRAEGLRSFLEKGKPDFHGQ